MLPHNTQYPNLICSTCSGTTDCANYQLKCSNHFTPNDFFNDLFPKLITDIYLIIFLRVFYFFLLFTVYISDISVSTMHICNCHLEATALMSLLLSAPHRALMLHSFSGYMECQTGRVTLIHSAITSRAQRYEAYHIL